MALTKSVAAVDEWAEVAQAGLREGATTDVSGCYAAILHIFCCLSSTTAHTGTEIIVQISSNTSGDEDWTDLVRFIGPTGTASKADFGGDEAAAQTELSITNPATANLDHDKKLIFIEHTGTVANCEVAYQVSNTGDAGDTITIQDGLTNAQTAADSDVYTVDGDTASAVGVYVVELPMAANRVRVLYNNNYDADGSTVHTNCRISKVTAI